MSNDTEIGTDKRPVPAIYVRVSTEEQAQSGTSLDSQLAALRKEIETARLHKPLEFVDGGDSGVAANRPGLMRLEPLRFNAMPIASHFGGEGFRSADCRP